MYKPSKEKLDKAIIPKLNSTLFNMELYNRDNSILLHFDKMKEYAIGWCFSDETCIPYRGQFDGEIAIMYEVPETEVFIETGKYWNHLGIMSFINLFIPDYFNE